MENRTKKKTRCPTCSKLFLFHKFLTHKCPALRRQSPKSNCTLHNEEDLKCTFCGLQMANPKLLEIHMSSCMHRNIPQMCKVCRNPIRLRSHDKQYCANCLTVKGNSETGLRIKSPTETVSLANKSSQLFTVSARNTEKRNFSTVNGTIASSLISARRRMEPVSDSQKQRKGKLKIKFVDHPVKKKQVKIASQKISDKETNTEKNIQVGLHQLCELRLMSDKVSKSSERIAMQQKKYLSRTCAEAVSDKIKNNLQRLNLKSSPQMEPKTRQITKKNDNLLSKSNPTNKVTVKLLLDTIPESDCGMLLHSSSANKMDHYYKCCRCGKAFRSLKLGSTHLANCKSSKLLSNEVSVSDVKWVCTICHSFFVTSINLTNHVKGCNILKNKYDRACEKKCERCHFRCLSSLKFEEHDCSKELKSMETCAVKLNVVKMTSTAGRIVMRECEFCSEIFDEQLTAQHFQSHHPGLPISGNFKQYYVNLSTRSDNPPKDTVVVKTEPVSPVHEYAENGSNYIQDPHHYSLIDNYPFNPVPDNISMPPPMSLPIVQSTVSLPTHQSASALGHPSSSHPTSYGPRTINEQICRCVNRKVGIDTKPCLRCLSKFDITRFAPNFNVLPFKVAKIKKEASEDSEVLHSSSQAHFDTGASLTEVGGGMVENLFPYSLLDPFQLNPSLTPPSSHNGISPPSTPFVQSLVNGDPCSASDVSIGSLNDAISMVPDISQLDEPRSPDDLVQYINDDSSPDIPLEQCDDQELFIPIDSCTISHLWDVDKLDTVDAWAVVPSEGNETVEKYICSECIAFSCLDRNVIIKHLYKNHEKKLHFVAMYIKKLGSDL